MKRRFGIFRGRVPNEPVTEELKLEFQIKYQKEEQLRQTVSDQQTLLRALEEQLARNSRWKEKLGQSTRIVQYLLFFIGFNLAWDAILALDHTYILWFYDEYDFERAQAQIAFLLGWTFLLGTNHRLYKQLEDLRLRY